MNRKPIVGDLIDIPGSRCTQVVVAFIEEVSEDRLRGDAYYATTFDTINYRQTTQTSSNPKVNQYYLTGGSMNLSHRVLIDLKDIKLLGFSEVRKHVDVTYGFGRVKAAKD